MFIRVLLIPTLQVLLQPVQNTGHKWNAQLSPYLMKVGLVHDGSLGMGSQSVGMLGFCLHSSAVQLGIYKQRHMVPGNKGAQAAC